MTFSIEKHFTNHILVQLIFLYRMMEIKWGMFVSYVTKKKLKKKTRNFLFIDPHEARLLIN